MHMKNRIGVAGGITALALLSMPVIAFAQEPLTGGATPEQVIEPQLQRRTVKVPKIDADDFEIGLYTGIYSAEDFGSSSVQSARLTYHVTEDIFFEAAVGRTQVSDELFRQILPGGVFPQPVEDLTYYSLSIGYNFFPGEVFISRDLAFASAVYVIAGIGNTSFIDEDRSTISFGIGIRLLLTDSFAVHVGMRDHLFESDILGQKKTSHNFELHTGLSFYF
jgi:outer membrane beta-barrel protein